MLKKLRNRLLLVNMVALSLVMITAFSVIYAITYSNAMDEIEDKVQRVPLFFAQSAKDSSQSVNQNEAGAINKDRSSANNFLAKSYADAAATNKTGKNTLPIDFAPCFIIYLNFNGEVLGYLTYLDIPYESYDAALGSIKEIGSTTGQIEFEGRHWQFAYTANDPLISATIFSEENSGNPLEFSGQAITQINLVDITDTTDSLARLLITFIVVGVVMMVVLFSISLFFANRSIRPLEETWEKQRQFVTDASHELKTPIAIIGANLDALESNAQDKVIDQKKWMDYARHELKRMGRLINDLLYLSQTEDGRTEVLVFNLSDLVLRTSTSMEAVLFEKNIEFIQDIETDLYVRADEEKIGQALIILLDNAAKYTQQDGSIRVAACKDRSWAKVTVKNSGPEIAAQDLSRIFDRFYRPDQSRSTQSGGYGLGLSIFKAIIERSGGKISATSANNETEFCFMIKIESGKKDTE